MPTAIDNTRYESDVVLRDGSTIRIRTYQAADAEAMVALHARLSDRSRFHRFLQARPHLDAGSLSFLTQVDGEQVFALVAESGKRLVGAAHFFRNPQSPQEAEVAFAIADVIQGRGLGTQLLERLADAARDRDIRTFSADVYCDNTLMMDVFLHAGFGIVNRMRGDTYHVSLQLDSNAEQEARHRLRARQAATASMRRLFEPRTVAVVGAGASPDNIGNRIVRNLLSGEFSGGVYPVHPHARYVHGLRAHAHVGDIADDIDLAVLAVPARAMLDVAEEAIIKGAKAIVVISAGFAETDAAGRSREEALLGMVRDAGIRLVGPNCLGLINTDPQFSMHATFAQHPPPVGRIAIATQSGAVGISVLERARQAGLGVSNFVSLGNKADVSGNDLIQYWAEDPRTDVILLYLESLGNPRRFGRIAPEVALRKPIVALKAGRTHAGARAASSHSAALACADTAVDTLFREAGIIRADNLEEMFEAAIMLAHHPLPRGRRVAVLTNAGGLGIMAADACEVRDLSLPTLSDDTVQTLQSFLPPTAACGNPVDMGPLATPQQYEDALDAIARDPYVDAVVAFHVPLATDGKAQQAAIEQAAARMPEVPVVHAIQQSPQSAVRALAHACDRTPWLARPRAAVPRFDDMQVEVLRNIVDTVMKDRRGGWLMAAEAEQLMAAMGIEVARSRTVPPDVSKVAAAADQLGYPCVLKALGQGILHKTERHGVKVGIVDHKSCVDAYMDLHHRFDGEWESVLVQQMIDDGVEVVVGATVDPMFGPLLMYGSGGTLLELVKDVTFGLHPLTDDSARQMLERVKGTARLRGFRGAPRADEAAVCEVLLRLSAALSVCDGIAELDINPLLVRDKGAVAVDVRVRVGHQSTPSSRRVAY
jgi:acyl-CoA synthetase (NDP forming)/RimJ/RimL family protein N-acetyltransferase